MENQDKGIILIQSAFKLFALTISILIVSLLILSGCGYLGTEAKTEISSFTDETSSGTDIPYNFSKYVHKAPILQGEIIEVQQPTVSYAMFSTDDKGNYDYYESLVQSSTLMTIKVEQVYDGDSSLSGKEIKIFTTVSNGHGGFADDAFSKGKHYVFLCNYFSDDQVKHDFDLWDINDYGFDKQADFFMYAGQRDIFPVYGDLIQAQAEWGDIVAPTYPKYPLTEESYQEYLDICVANGMTTNEQSEGAMKDFLSFSTPEAFLEAYRLDPLYSNTDLATTLKELQKQY